MSILSIRQNRNQKQTHPVSDRRLFFNAPIAWLALLALLVALGTGMGISSVLSNAKADESSTNKSNTNTNNKLPESVVELLRHYKIPTSAVSIEVADLDAVDSQPLLSIKTKAQRNPASAIKLLTTLSALELLGPSYLWQTTYLADGKISDGVLNGNLIMQGSGDPFITVERFLEHILALRQQGIKKITGGLVIDNSRFVRQPDDRSALDDQPHRLYNVEPDAALTNFSASQFVIEPRGDKIHIRVEPPLAGLKVINQVTPQDGKCLSPEAGWTYRVSMEGKEVVLKFSGTYRPRCEEYTFSRSILGNVEYTHRLFTALWRFMGGELELGNRTGLTPETAQVLVIRESEPLADIISGINKFSNNVMSRQLLLTVAAESTESPGDVAPGVAAIRAWLADVGLEMPNLVMDNGSGLSRKTRSSVHELSALLDYGWRSVYRPEFVSSFPLVAMDGTLKKRLAESELGGRARIKTGLLDGVRSMAGYVHAKNGRHYRIAMTINSLRVHYWNGNEIQDAILQWVYER